LKKSWKSYQTIKTTDGFRPEDISYEQARNPPRQDGSACSVVKPGATKLFAYSAIIGVAM